jgi:uncharacterized glyoxalase superfamily protein PhnB
MSRVHMILYVRDQAASATFYERVLGTKATLNVPGMTELLLGADVVLGLMPEAGIRRLLGDSFASAPVAGAPRAEVYVVVPDPEAHHARALAAGARELSPMQVRDWGHRVAYSLDPDGYVLAFAGLN